MICTYNIIIDVIGKTGKEIVEDIIEYIVSSIKNVRNTKKDPDSIYIDYKRFPTDDYYISILGRKLETIYSEQIDDIINIICNWSNDSDIYHKHGLAFKTGIILHGVPGTGKTSIVKALSTYFAMNMITLNIASISAKDLIKFSQQIRTDENKIVLLEEIDLRDSDEKDKKMQELLTLLDGVDGVNNIIFIATTNDIDGVDVRLKRPGRFDNIIEITNINIDLATKMCESFKVDSNIVLENYNIKFPNSEKYNPATLQAEILNEYHKQKSNINNIVNIDNINLKNKSNNKTSCKAEYTPSSYIGEVNSFNINKGVDNKWNSNGHRIYGSEPIYDEKIIATN